MSEAEVAQTPSQTIGPFWHHALLQYAPDDLDPQRNAGSPMILQGRITDGAGEPVTDAMIEFWQADGDGRYRHPVDPAAGQMPYGFVGFGRVATDDDGGYYIRTVVPGSPTENAGDVVHAPHLNVQLFARGLLRLLSTRVYLPGPLTDEDPVLTLVPAERRQTLVAQSDGEADGVPVFRFDIVLQGTAETVFFDL